MHVPKKQLAIVFGVISTPTQHLLSTSPLKNYIFPNRNARLKLLLHSGDHTNEKFRCLTGETSTVSQLLLCSFCGNMCAAFNRYIFFQRRQWLHCKQLETAGIWLHRACVVESLRNVRPESLKWKQKKTIWRSSIAMRHSTWVKAACALSSDRFWVCSLLKEEAEVTSY